MDVSKIVKYNTKVMTKNGKLGRFGKIVLRIANGVHLFVKFVKGVDGSIHIVLVNEHYEPHPRVGVLCNDVKDVETPSKNLVSYWFLKYHDVFCGYDRILKEKDKYGILSDSVSELEMKLTLGGY